MYTGARFYAVVGPRGKTQGWWPDWSYQYLCAFQLADVPVRALAIGGMVSVTFSNKDYCPNAQCRRHQARRPIQRLGPGSTCPTCGVYVESRRHWSNVAPLFSAQVQPSVNIVCAPVGLVLGAEQSGASLAPAVPEGMRNAPNVPVGDRSIVYVPGTALSALRTDDMVNIAITGVPGHGCDDARTAAELVALAQYDEVLSPTAHDAFALRSYGLTVHHVVPQDLPGWLGLSRAPATTIDDDQGFEDCDTGKVVVPVTRDVTIGRYPRLRAVARYLGTVVGRTVLATILAIGITYALMALL